MIVLAKDVTTAKSRVDAFKEAHWGAKTMIDQKVEDSGDPVHPIKLTLYYVDNHKHGHWQPWKDSKKK